MLQLAQRHLLKEELTGARREASLKPFFNLERSLQCIVNLYDENVVISEWFGLWPCLVSMIRLTLTLSGRSFHSLQEAEAIDYNDVFVGAHYRT